MTFLVIVATVTFYGLAASPGARLLRLGGVEPLGEEADEPPAPLVP